MVATLAGLAVGLSGGRASADDVQVNTYTTGDQRRPSVAVDAEGNAVFAWESAGSGGTDTSETSVQARLYAANGAPLTGEFQVNTYTTDDQREPAVARAASGEFIVVWTSVGSSGDDTSSASIQGQRYTADGSPQGSEIQINDFTTSGQYRPSVAMDADGNFVVTWLSFGSHGDDDSGNSVQARRFDSNGLPVGGQFQVNTYTTFDQKTPDVAMNDAGEFVVVWKARDRDDGGYVYYSAHGQRYSSDGSPAGPYFFVSEDPGATEDFPSVAMDPAGEFFVVVWTYRYVYGQRFSADDGSPLGDQLEIDKDYGFPSVAMKAGGEFIVAWQDGDPVGNDTSSWAVSARRYDAFGNPIFGEFQVNTYTTDRQQYPEVAMDADGDFVVVWESRGSVGSDADGYSIQRTASESMIFVDGFESGDTSAWE